MLQSYVLLRILIFLSTHTEMFQDKHEHETFTWHWNIGSQMCTPINIYTHTNTHTHTPLFPSSGHGPLAEACRPFHMIHGQASCCRAVLNHWAEESLCVIKAQRAGHAVRAAAPWPALCLSLALQEVRKQVLLYVVVLLIVVLLEK